MRKFFVIILSLIFLIASSGAFALPFEIVPKAGTQLPTFVYSGRTTTAYYTIFNSTGSQRNNNFVDYLPLNVSQVTSGGTYPDTCGSTFNLAPHNQSGGSCTLQLLISGSVYPDDPDQTHQLFVCFPGGRTCAGTLYPLNVSTVENPLSSITVTPVMASINLGGTQQYKATGNYDGGTTVDLTSTVTWNSSNTSVAQISSSGLASGSGVGNTQITASTTGVTSNSATLSVANPLLSIAITPATPIIRLTGSQQFVATGTYQNGATQDFTTMVTWASSLPAVATINPATGLASSAATTFGTTTISATYAAKPSIVITPVTLTVAAFAYITNVFNNTLTYCVINPTNGTLSNCANTGNITFNEPSGMVIDPTYKFAYIGSNDSGAIYYCTINGDGSLGNCQTSGCNTYHTYALAINTSTSTLWATDFTGAFGQGIYYCSISSTTGEIGGSNTPGGSQPEVSALAFNPGNSVLIYGNYQFQELYYGQLTGNSFISYSAAIGTNIPFPGAIAINAAGTYAYVSNSNGSQIYQCTFSSPTSFSSCVSTYSLSGVSSIAMNNTGTMAYVEYGQGYASGTLDLCTINTSTGAFGTCSSAGATLIPSPRTVVLLYH